MSFGQVVVGPPGSGKTTYCRAMRAYLENTGRKVAVISLDPANVRALCVCVCVWVWGAGLPHRVSALSCGWLHGYRSATLFFTCCSLKEVHAFIDLRYDVHTHTAHTQ